MRRSDKEGGDSLNGQRSHSDEQLIAQIAKGNLEPLGELYLRYGAMVSSALIRFSPGIPPADVDELTHEVFLTVVQKAPGYQEQTKFKSWLYGIAIFKAKQWNRTSWNRVRLLKQRFRENAPVAMAVPSEINNIEKFELHRDMEAALSKLAPKYRDVLLLSVIEEFSAEEIATMLDVSVQVVWTRLHRARKQLVQLLKKAKFNVPGGSP